jgi:hypothetical protein
MKFVEKNESNEKFYSVDYDKEKLREILEELKGYSYVKTGSEIVGGEIITRWPATKKNIEKRVTHLFYTTLHRHSPNAILDQKTIVHHTENNKDYVTFDYSYNKLPDLYAYIEMILNNDYPTFRKYAKLFKETSDAEISTIYEYTHSDQLILEGLFNYVNSPELTNHNSNDEGETSKQYDYKGLNELYKETLKCLHFNLVAVKEYLKVPEPVDILELQLKKTNQ